MINRFIETLKIYTLKAKLFLRIFTEKISPWSLYSKFSIHRYFYKNDELRYKNFSSKDKFVNLGAGSYFYHPRWHCLDFYNNGMNKVHKNYIKWDFTKKKDLPFTYKLAYCSHVIEHIPENDIKDFLQIVYRSLDKNGILRIVTPDADSAYAAYSENRLDYFEIYMSKLKKNVPIGYEIEYLLLDYFATFKRRNNRFNAIVGNKIRENFKSLNKREFLNYLISGIDENSVNGMDHVNWFNYEKIYDLLKEIGFRKIYKSEFGKSKTPVMRSLPLFDGWLPSISLFVEAEK